MLGIITYIIKKSIQARQQTNSNFLQRSIRVKRVDGVAVTGYPGRMKNRTRIIVISVILLALLGTYLFWERSTSTLPETFTLQLGQDTTSSGGSRYTVASLSYVQGVLAQGTLVYAHGRETTAVDSCTFEQSRWMTADGLPCAISFIEIPQTRKEVQILMDTKRIKPLGDSCQHREVCFTVGK